MICGICLDRIYLFYHKCDCQCKTYYHRTCITNWYKIKEACPICKTPKISEEQQIRPSIILFLSRLLRFLKYCLFYNNNVYPTTYKNESNTYK